MLQNNQCAEEERIKVVGQVCWAKEGVECWRKRKQTYTLLYKYKPSGVVPKEWIEGKEKGWFGVLCFALERLV